MSSLICAKIRDVVVLAADSRTLDQSGRVSSDHARKIYELTPGLHYAWSGYQNAAVPQSTIATALAQSQSFSSLPEFANRLDELSAPLLVQMVRWLVGNCNLRSQYVDQLTGSAPIHAYAVAGLCGGVPAFIVREFYLRDGSVVHDELLVDVLPAGNDFAFYATRGRLIQTEIANPSTWSAGPINGIEKLSAVIAAREPEVGGDVQMVVVDGRGSKWIHQPHGEAICR
jgi:hypothetical protein